MMDETSASLETFLETLARSDTRKILLDGLRGGATGLVISRMVATTKRPLLVLAPSENETSLLEQDLRFFAEIEPLTYPSHDIPPFSPLSPDPGTNAHRLAALYKITAGDTPPIILVPVEAALRRTLPKPLFISCADLLAKGEETDQLDLSHRLTALGYQHVSLVQSAGEYSVRGGIIDIFAPGLELPVRLDFFGDTLESIRYFDPITQRSVDELDEVILLPCRDILFPTKKEAEMHAILARLRQRGKSLGWDLEKTGRMADQIATKRLFPGVEFFLPLFYDTPSTLFDYLPEETLVVLLNGQETKAMVKRIWEKINTNYLEAADKKTPALPPAELFLEEKELFDRLAGVRTVWLNDFPEPHQPTSSKEIGGEEPAAFSIRACNHQLIKQQIELERKAQGLLAPLAQTMAGWLEDGDTVIMACLSDRHVRHLSDLLGQYHIQTLFHRAPLQTLPRNGRCVHLVDATLSGGFDLPDQRLHLLSENELFGGRLKPTQKRRRKHDSPPISFEELNIGDIVVHRDHGLGIYEGIANLRVGGIANDFILIRYHGEDRLYVPVDRLKAVSKYKGVSDLSPKLDKLGGKSWENTKNKVKEAVWKVAQELLDLYAKRNLSTGHLFSDPDELYRELEESFPFDETSGQLKAINEVLDDLCGDRPMDRLVCGDVGYGKTEVAVRAAFKVIEDNLQVAMLVPTTVLAEQHTETFRDRFHGFPVTIETLSRFRTAAEQREVLRGISRGDIDLVIGTHRLLSNDIVFKRLGLLIIDEEHRFGVKHKEKLKKLRANVDVLTLTATPIPRTLQMSLLGIRDLSVISTPPAQRLSVKTFISEYDDMIVREAISRELYRRGQCFVVHNRVSSIHDMAGKIQKLVPEARIAVAHGQMAPKSLEEIMVKFVRKEIDILVCTTIIESGLDIPNANTIIITRADRLGLAEIYQLRGRVGRSKEQAYAYLLMPSMDGLSKDAQQRLRALMDYNELGGGFKLAMSDLQIRGGGNILGVSQSGNIAAVGYDLYLELLQKTVDDMKREGMEGKDQSGAEEIDPEINLQISAFIPATYISDTTQRYFAYRKLTSLNSEEELFDLLAEFRDRYGEPPEEARNLYDIIQIKLLLKKQRITKLEQGPGTLVFTFQNDTPLSPAKVLLFLKDPRNKARITPDSRLIAQASTTSSGETIEAVKKILRALTRDDN